MAFESPILHNRLALFLFYGIIALVPYYRIRHMAYAMPLDWYLTIFSLFFAAMHFVFIRQIPPFMKNRLNRFLILFFTLNIIASLFSPYPAQALDGMMTLTLGYTFIYLNLIFISRRGFTTLLPFTLTTSIVLNALFASLGYFAGVEYFNQLGRSRVFGFTIGANNMALMGIFLMPILAHFITTAKRVSLVVFFSALFLIDIAGIISSASRGGTLVMIMMFFGICFEYRHRFHPRYLGLIIGLAMMGTLLAVSAIPDSYFERQKTLVSGPRDKSLNRRADYIRVAIDSIFQHPVMGTGADTFKQVWYDSLIRRKYKFEVRPAHNTYLEVSVATGLVGLGVFLAMLFQGFRDFSLAKQQLLDTGQEEMASLVAAYRLSFLCILAYFFLKSGLDHKFYLLILPLSQVAYHIAFQPDAQQSEYVTE